ncbi:MAG TPA: response regulator [Planctomycetota bacterium]|nr:response regulator [Planctomycetota bacterium]
MPILEILHVDDNREDLELTAMAFEQADPEVGYVGKNDSAAGLAYLERLAGERALPPPHLFIFDINMPGMTGIELLERVKAHPKLRAIPVVILTTSNQPADRARTLAVGAARYVIKPSRFDDLVAIARELLDSLGDAP